MRSSCTRRLIHSARTGANPATFGGAVSNGGLTKSGASTLILSGANTYGGRTFAVRVSVQTTGEHRFLATSSGDARGFGPGDGIIKVLPFAEAVKLHPGEHEKEEEAPPYAAVALEGWAEAQHEKAFIGDYAGQHPRWGMAVDLAKCTGCSACVTACYAENNLATVGEELFMRHRQMSWIRIDRYFKGDLDGPEAIVSGMPPDQTPNFFTTGGSTSAFEKLRPFTI